MENTLKDLVTNCKRGRVKASLTRFKTACVDATVTAAFLEERLRLNSGLFQQFTEIQDKIEDLIQRNEDQDAQVEEREAFESLYCEVFAIARERIATLSSTVLRAPSAMNTPSATPTPDRAERPVKLPAISLPSFDGSYGDWVRFRDSYQSLVHENEKLADIQKFYYLDSALKGNAARVIRSLGVSEANHNQAWETIRARYEDSRALIHHHTKTLLQLPTVTKRTFNALRQFTDDFNNQIITLKALEKDVDKCDWLITFLMMDKLDSTTKSEWNKKTLSLTNEPTLKDFSDFLNDQCKYLELSGSTKNVTVGNVAPVSSARTYRGPPNSSASHVASVQSCILCKGAHYIYACETLQRLTPPERVNEIRRLRVCFNCFRAGHGNKTCSRGACRKCGKKHHTLLHIESPEANSPSASRESSTPNIPLSATAPSQALASHSHSSNYVMLSTAVIHIENADGAKCECRALLDSGSQSHFITDNLSRELGLPRMDIGTTVSGIGHISRSIQHQVSVNIFSRFTGFKTNISCLLIPKITDEIPNIPLTSASIPIPSDFVLADPQYACPGKIDLLIGAGLFWDILCVGQHKLGPQYPLLQKTQFGWIIAGTINGLDSHSPSYSKTHLVTNDMLQDGLSKFWNLEAIEPTRTVKRLPREFCEEHFLNSTIRDSTGRFVVSIPFNDNLRKLGDSRDMAERRFRSLEKRLSKEPHFKQEYSRFIKEYVELGHATEINIPSERRELTNFYYLPHHAVLEETSTTTKLRVVFDGSAKTSSGLSLNEVQHVRPSVQNDLFSILLRFRKHRFVLSANIEKMYRQIWVDSSQRQYQRILWRSDPSTAIKTFQLNTVTYGTASAPFLATRSLRMLGEEKEQQFPMASRAIINDFYVDDLLTGANTIEEAVELRRRVSSILAQAGFLLRKWASSDPRILVGDNRSTEDTVIHTDHGPKTLGLLWNSNKDILRYRVTVSENPRITKRTILSEISQIFDPLGLIGPATILAKIILQRLWQLEISWDESLPQDLHTHWRTFRSKLAALNTLQIPRCIIGQNYLHFQLHGFCDASESAYGACIYIRTHCRDDTYVTHLLCAKSRVAPLKTVSLPRLELCGALLLAQLAAKAKESLKLDFQGEEYWCDSMVTLAWIKSPPSRWKTFVANRTSEIQSLTTENWTYVQSRDNPADIISRGLCPSALERAELWWHGPSWLMKPRHLWPSHREHEPVDLPEIKQQNVLTVTEAADFDIFARYSSFNKLLRVTAYCLRFYNNTRRNSLSRNADLPVRYGPLNTDELHKSETTLTNKESARSSRHGFSSNFVGW